MCDNNALHFCLCQINTHNYASGTWQIVYLCWVLAFKSLLIILAGVHRGLPLGGNPLCFQILGEWKPGSELELVCCLRISASLAPPASQKDELCYIIPAPNRTHCHTSLRTIGDSSFWGSNSKYRHQSWQVRDQSNFFSPSPSLPACMLIYVVSCLPHDHICSILLPLHSSADQTSRTLMSKQPKHAKMCCYENVHEELI